MQIIDTVKGNMLFTILLQWYIDVLIQGRQQLWYLWFHYTLKVVVTEYVVVFLKTVPGRNTNAVDILVLNLSRTL